MFELGSKSTDSAKVLHKLLSYLKYLKPTLKEKAYEVFHEYDTSFIAFDAIELFHKAFVRLSILILRNPFSTPLA